MTTTPTVVIENISRVRGTTVPIGYTAILIDHYCFVPGVFFAQIYGYVLFSLIFYKAWGILVDPRWKRPILAASGVLPEGLIRVMTPIRLVLSLPKDGAAVMAQHYRGTGGRKQYESSKRKRCTWCLVGYTQDPSYGPILFSYRIVFYKSPGFFWSVLTFYKARGVVVFILVGSGIFP